MGFFLNNNFCCLKLFLYLKKRVHSLSCKEANQQNELVVEVLEIRETHPDCKSSSGWFL